MTAEAGTAASGRAPVRAEGATRSLGLFFHELRMQQLMFWRNRESAVFVFVFPPMLFLLLGAMCLLPLFLADLMTQALERLHLAPSAALLCVIGIFVGGLINVPIYRYPPPEVVPIERFPQVGPDGIIWGYRELRPPDPVLAVNLGGCVIPLILAVVQISALETGEPIHLREPAGPELALLALPY